MSLFIFKKLIIGKAKPITIALQLADKSIVQLEGKIEYVLIKVDKFIFSVNLIIQDYEVEGKYP